MLKRVPALRFPEFLEGKEWQEKPLYSVCQMKAGKFISASKINTQYIEGLHPCYGGNGLRGFTSEYSHSGEYSLIGRQGALCGNVNFVIGRFYATEHAVVVSPNKKINNNWLFYCLNKLNLNQYAIGQAQPGLSVNFLEKITIQIPEQVKEQQKIANCLSSLDNVISIHTQKIDALQQYKNGLMQKLFPAKDEIVPELRFDEFKNKPKWDKKELSQVTTLVKEKKHIDNFTINNYVSTENIKPDFLGIDIASQLPLNCRVTTFNSGDILISNIRPYLKKIWLADKSGGASNDVLVIRCKSNVNNVYLSFILKNDNFINYVMSGAKGVKMPRGDINLIKKFTVTLPSVSEQKKIADFLSSLDELIAAETQKLATLKTHKTGLMQQLFPSMDEVSA